jgi:hypothetical protein
MHAVMTPKHVPPSITSVSFSCPHCGAHAHQDWYKSYAKQIAENETPHLADDELLDWARNDKNISAASRGDLVDYVERSIRGEVFLGDGEDIYKPRLLVNVSLSKCYSCARLSMWINDHVVDPPLRHGEEPNADLPEEIRRDYEEARSIVDLSPRGAAGLLRLAIQKICIFLGETGKNIDDDIASLVRKGLDARVQKALDIVRVIGNEAVHPGQMDLRDDRDTATELFRIVNFIADIMISQPKAIDAIYNALPASKLKGIADRDKVDAAASAGDGPAA